jgi:hypothetical protein
MSTRLSVQPSAPSPTLAGSWSPHQVVRVAALGIATLVAVLAVAAGAAEGVGLVLLSALAVLGLFFGYGMLAGYIRIDLGAPAASLESRVARHADAALEVVGMDGRIHYANRSAATLCGTRAASIEHLLVSAAGDGDAAYRLATAAARGEQREEIVPRNSAGCAFRFARSTAP